MRISPIVGLVVATTLVRLGFAATTGLGVDESYMVAAGRVLSLGYFDHPPASWWLSWGAAQLLGTEAPVAVRLPFILLFAVSQVLMWRIGRLVAGPRAGLCAAVVLNLSPVFGVTTGSWVLPDGPLDAALLGAALCLLRAVAFAGPGGAEPGGVEQGLKSLMRSTQALSPDNTPAEPRDASLPSASFVDAYSAVPPDASLPKGSSCFGSAARDGSPPQGSPPAGGQPTLPDWSGANALSTTIEQTAMSWWIAAGLCAGLALGAKYSAVLSIAGAFLYLATSRAHRRWLARPGPYVAAALAAAIFCPVLTWNAIHGWASIAFQGQRAAGLRFNPLAPLTTLAGEALFVLPWLWLPMMALFVGGFRREVPWTHRLLVWLAAPPIVGFALISAWSSQRVLFHWAAPGYLMLFPLLGDAIARRLDQAWVRRGLAATAALLLATLAVISSQIQFDWLGDSLAAVMRRDPTEEALDWISLRSDLRARGLLPPGTVAAAMNWRDAGKIGYALGPDVPMLCLCTDSRQFGLARPPREYVGQTVLVLVLDPAERSMQQAALWFHSTQRLPDTSIRLHGRILRTVTIALGDKLLIPTEDTGDARHDATPVPAATTQPDLDDGL